MKRRKGSELLGVKISHMWNDQAAWDVHLHRTWLTWDFSTCSRRQTWKGNNMRKWEDENWKWAHFIALREIYSVRLSFSDNFVTIIDGTENVYIPSIHPSART